MKSFTILIVFILIQISGIAQTKEDSLYTSFKTYDYTEIDRKVHTMESGKTIPDHAAKLSKLCKNDQEKVRAAYIWVSTFMSYSFSYTDNTAETAFKTRKGVCQHFASIFNELCINMNIQSFLVIGIVKDENLKSQTHAWNAVIIQGQYFLLDPTWGQNDLEKYFLANPKEIILTHYPNDIKFQLLKETVTYEYFNSPGAYIHKYKKYPHISPEYAMLK